MTISGLNLVNSEKLKQAISRVLLLMTINLVPMLPAESSGLPWGLKSGSLYSSLFSLSPSGVYPASPITQRAVGSYIKPISGPTFSPLPRKNYRAVCFLWHFPWDHSHSVLQSAVSCGARTFLFVDYVTEQSTKRPSCLLQQSTPIVGCLKLVGSDWTVSSRRVGKKVFMYF